MDGFKAGYTYLKKKLVNWKKTQKKISGMEQGESNR